jgi:hypothetical protein
MSLLGEDMDVHSNLKRRTHKSNYKLSLGNYSLTQNNPG